MSIGDSFGFTELDEITRGHMLDEFDLDHGEGKIYKSRLMSDHGIVQFPTLLRIALQSGDERTLTTALLDISLWGPRKYSKKESRLAEGEFNFFYMRGLVVRILSEDTPAIVVVFRAKQVVEPRINRKTQIGQEFACEDVLHALRNRKDGIDSFGLLEPNTGISIMRKR